MLELSHLSRILVIKLMYLGDVVLATPVLECLKRHLPGAALSMAVNAGTEEVLHNNPHLDEVLVVSRRKTLWNQIGFLKEIRARRFDLVLDLTDGDRSAILSFLSGAKHRIGFNGGYRWRGRLYHQVVRAERHRMLTVDYNLKMVEAIGCNIEHQGPRLYPSAGDVAVVENLLHERGLPPTMPFILFHPGARHWFKAWPPERFGALARRWHEQRGHAVVVAGGANEIQAAGEIASACGNGAISLAGQLSFLQLAALAARARLFVGNDAGPGHIAAAMGTPVVSLFGPTDPTLWRPWGDRHQVIWKQTDCTACWQQDCRRGEMNCLRQIGVDEVWDAVQRIMAQSPERRAG